MISRVPQRRVRFCSSCSLLPTTRRNHTCISSTQRHTYRQVGDRRDVLRAGDLVGAVGAAQLLHEGAAVEGDLDGDVHAAAVYVCVSVYVCEIE